MGGFSSVYEVQHKVDQQKYAVKKTVLRTRSHNPAQVREELLRLLKEVRLLAIVLDPHIIRYNHSWLEVTECSSSPFVPASVSVSASASAPAPASPSASSSKEEVPEIVFTSPYIEFAASPVAHEPPSPKESSSYAEAGGSFRVKKIALYIQMELCRTTLEDQLEKLNERYPKLSDEAGYRARSAMAKQIVDAVFTIHKVHRLIHRDLSLRNVFVTHDGLIKIGDFGLATESKHLVPLLASPNSLRPADPKFDPNFETQPDALLLLDSEASDLPYTGHLGTKTFAAPEQLNGGSYDQSADIYSLGLILLALFYPTATVCERQVILSRCAEFGPPADFVLERPELALLIQQMTSTIPAFRPSIEEVKSRPTFRNPKLVVRNGRCYSLPGAIEGGLNVVAKVGSSAHWKERFLTLTKDAFLLYSRAGATKAKCSYPLKECRLSRASLQGPEVREDSEAIEDHKNPLPTTARHFSEGGLPNTDGTGVTCVVQLEHPQLETLFLRVDSQVYERLAIHIGLARVPDPLPITPN